MHINTAQWNVDTVLLDMDGTLLDLVFDNYFWQRLVPETRGTKNGVTSQEAMEYIRQQHHDVQHMLNWYCLDYWSEQLGLDICTMTTKMGPRAVLREDTIPFLGASKASGKQRILLTNAYPHNPVAKLKHIGLDTHPNSLFSTHASGYPKEDQRLWYVVIETTDLRAERTLFIDDSEAILDTAAQFGIRYYLGVINPDSGIAEKRYQRHPLLNDYRRLVPSLM